VKSRLSNVVFLGIVVLLLVLLIIGLKPYLTAILSALVFGPLFLPVCRRIRRKVGRPWLAAAATLALILAGVIVPLGILGTLAFNEAQEIAGHYKGLASNVPDVVIFGRNLADLFREAVGNLLSWIQSSLGSIFSGTLLALVNFFVMLYLIYYLLLEEGSLERLAMEMLPFREEDSRRLFEDFRRMARGFLYGQGITALLQGFLGGIGFLVFGFPGALLWGMVMAVLSLIPVLGSFLIWVPAGILQILSGSTGSGLGILIWGALVVSMADNVVRPLLMKNMAGVHPVVTLLGVFAGLSLFGLIGIIIGPILFSLVLETTRMFYREQREAP